MDYKAAVEIHDRKSELWLHVVVARRASAPVRRHLEIRAHNQRSHITIKARVDQHVAGRADRHRGGRSPLRGIRHLKRPDEKYVTERAYENPKFVEDIVRDIAVRCNKEERIREYSIEAENFESIHNHSAYALIERNKDQAVSG
jgi:GTP cyclohydrolase I